LLRGLDGEGFRFVDEPRDLQGALIGGRLVVELRPAIGQIVQVTAEVGGLLATALDQVWLALVLRDAGERAGGTPPQVAVLADHRVEQARRHVFGGGRCWRLGRAGFQVI
jgi:hypothetical protein